MEEPIQYTQAQIDLEDRLTVMTANLEVDHYYLKSFKKFLDISREIVKNNKPDESRGILKHVDTYWIGINYQLSRHVHPIGYEYKLMRLMPSNDTFRVYSFRKSIFFTQGFYFDLDIQTREKTNLVVGFSKKTIIEFFIPVY